MIAVQLKMRTAREGEGSFSGLPSRITSGQFTAVGIDPASLDGRFFTRKDYTLEISGNRFFVTATDPESGLKYQIDQDYRETVGKGFFSTE